MEREPISEVPLLSMPALASVGRARAWSALERRRSDATTMSETTPEGEVGVVRVRADNRGAVPPLDLARSLAAVVPRLVLKPATTEVCGLRLAHQRQTRQVQCLAPFIEITVENNLSGSDWVVVSALGEGSAAEEGILVGDVILAVNEKRVNDHQTAIAEVNATIGPFVTLTLVKGTSRLLLDKSRGGIGITCVATPAALPRLASQQKIFPPTFPTGGAPLDASPHLLVRVRAQVHKLCRRPWRARHPRLPRRCRRCRRARGWSRHPVSVFGLERL